MSTNNRKLLTLAIITEADRVLLAMKKRGFGEGRYNGFGGKVEEGETIEDAVIREMEEEGGIRPRTMVKAGILEFSFATEPVVLEVHVFRVSEYEGVVAETEEMRPQWFLWEEVPYTEMWSDDEYWLPLLRAGKSFLGKFHFDAPATKAHAGTVLAYELNEVTAL